MFCLLLLRSFAALASDICSTVMDGIATTVPSAIHSMGISCNRMKIQNNLALDFSVISLRVPRVLFSKVGAFMQYA